MRYYAAVAPEGPCDVLDIGGGQFSVLARALWDDRPAVADIDRDHLKTMESRGFRAVPWNLIRDVQPVEAEFDVIVMSEVIEHLPVPSHLVLERIRKALRPGGVLLLSTPNLYRLRNIAYLMLGKSPFDHFRFPTDTGLGHMLEFSPAHLHWQLDRAGFKDVEIDRVSLPHNPTNPAFRVLKWSLKPLTWIPRYRDCLVGTARA